MAVFGGLVLAAEPPTDEPVLASPAEPSLTSGRDLGDNPTLAEYVDYALRHNPSAEAARLRAAAAAEKPAQEKALDNPTFVYSYALRSDMSRQSLSIEQMIPWPGTLSARRKMAEAMARTGTSLARKTALNVVYQVKRAYHEYYYLGRTTEVAQASLELMKQLHAAALARYRTAQAGYADVTKALVEIARMENDLRMYQDMRPSAAAKLNAAINRPAGEERPFPSTASDLSPGADMGSLLPRALAVNPGLAAMDAETEAAVRQVELAKKAYRPDFIVGLEWRDMVAPMMSNEYMAMAGITLPVWRSKYRAEEAEARFRVKAARADRAAEANMIAADLAMAAFRWKDADRRTRLCRDTLLPTAAEALKAAQAAYSAGGGMFLDLVDSQKTLLELELQYERALADRAISAAEIEMLTGDLPAVQPESEEMK